MEWRFFLEQAPSGGMTYLDYQATTPLAPEVAKAMQPWIEEKFANPHSPSRWGNEAEAAIVDEAHQRHRQPRHSAVVVAHAAPQLVS